MVVDTKPGATVPVKVMRDKQEKTLTITIDERVYRGLHKVVGRGRISQFIESLVRPHVLGSELEAGYRRMARDRKHEAEALEWIEATVGGVSDAAR